ncbi:MAG: redoxin family protein [Alphaproteobacteria bacterium]|nr:redoxin family protein [Alphaproteobacteria bacterium]
MFKKILYLTLAIGLFLGFHTGSAEAAAEVGQPAPAISATDINGNPFNLEDHKGKTVVLEWTNHQCPFVVKHYSTNNMQNAQKKATDNGVVWVSIVSSAEGKQGYLTVEEALAIGEENGAQYTAKILDPSGEIGKAYGATTTPHMFVISPEGKVVYAGAIDDNPSPSADAVEGAKNLVLAALEDLSAGRSIEVAQTAPYGCSVKY